MRLTKTDFIQYLNCPKSLWLAKHEPEIYPIGELSLFLQKLIRDGYAVERYVREFLLNIEGAENVNFQTIFETPSGLHARADAFVVGKNGKSHLYEVKSSTQVKTDSAHSLLNSARN